MSLAVRHTCERTIALYVLMRGAARGFCGADLFVAKLPMATQDNKRAKKVVPVSNCDDAASYYSLTDDKQDENSMCALKK